MTTPTVQGSGTTPAPRGRARRRIGTLLLAVGAALLLGAAWLGYTVIRGPSDLAPVPYGGQVVVTQHGLSAGTVYTTAGQEPPAACSINGEPISSQVPPSRNYLIDGLEATYMFSTSFPVVDGTTYAVTCGNPGEPGQFAAVQFDPEFQQLEATAVAVLGALVCLVGSVMFFRRAGADTAEWTPVPMA